MVAIIKSLLFTTVVTASGTNPIMDSLLTNVAPSLTTFTQSLNGFPASGINGVGAIHAAAQAFIAAIDKTATITDDSEPLSSPDSIAVLDEADILAHIGYGILDLLVADEPSFVFFPGQKTKVLSDIESMRDNVNIFYDSLVDVVSPDQTARAMSEQGNRDTAFASAVAAYA